MHEKLIIFSAFALKTENHSGLLSLFDGLVRGDHPEVKQVKPSPDIFLVACKLFG
jgi:beta-phosphoglucomutase-like phosphatase (HAD superfamily)